MATTSAPESLDPRGRLDPGAAAARTEELFREHGRMVGGLCRALLRDRVEAEDAAQQVFLSAHRALLNGSRPREAAAWLATIARNECVARVRARMRAPLATDDVEQQGTLPDPLAEAIRRADLAALWRAIRQLPEPQREALLLREFGGLTYDELAVALAVSESAVESLLFRARSALRARLEPVYAALSGASWVEWLGRLFAGGSSVAAPVAAKVVALGVGAAVVTGAGVEAPRLLEHRSSHAAATSVRPENAQQAPAGEAAASLLPVFAPFGRAHRIAGNGDGSPGEHAADTPDHPGGGDGGGDSAIGSSTAGDDGRGSAGATLAGGHDGGGGGEGSGGHASGGGDGNGGSDGGGTAAGTEPVSTTETATEPTTTTQETTTQETTTQETTTTEQSTEPITTATLTLPAAGDDGG